MPPPRNPWFVNLQGPGFEVLNPADANALFMPSHEIHEAMVNGGNAGAFQAIDVSVTKNFPYPQKSNNIHRPNPACPPSHAP